MENQTRTEPVHPLAGRLREGVGLLRQGRFAEAVAHSEALLAEHPGDVAALVHASETRLANDEPEAALAIVERAVEASGGNPSLMVKTAWLQARMRRREAAAATVEQARTRASGNAPLLAQLGAVLAYCNRHEAALGPYAQARAIAGDVPRLLYDTAVAQFFTGRFDEAGRNLDRMLELQPQAGHALYLRSTLRRQDPAGNHVDDLRRRLASGFSDPASRAACLYALAKELEDLGEHAESFTVLGEAARHKRATLQYDIGAECASLDRIREHWTADACGTGDGSRGEGVVFIVGLPRSGTTLVERLLVQQGATHPAGELLDFGTLLGAATRRAVAGAPGLAPARAALGLDFDALGEEYLRGAREAAGGSQRFIDKMPVNFLYCGMIRRALPGARILHLVRDPLDSAHAIYKTLFFNAYHFSYDLGELAEYYVAYRRLMEHWHAVLPGAILDVRYEDLVDDPEQQSRRILEWCGVEWRPGLLSSNADGGAYATASASQVREPVHRRSVGAAKRHADGLAPFVRRVREAGYAD